jgi:hypothetical protein
LAPNTTHGSRHARASCRARQDGDCCVELESCVALTRSVRLSWMAHVCIPRVSSPVRAGTSNKHANYLPTRQPCSFPLVAFELSCCHCTILIRAHVTHLRPSCALNPPTHHYLPNRALTMTHANRAPTTFRPPTPAPPPAPPAHASSTAHRKTILLTRLCGWSTSSSRTENSAVGSSPRPSSCDV